MTYIINSVEDLTPLQLEVLALLIEGKGPLVIAAEVMERPSQESTVRRWRDGILKPFLEDAIAGNLQVSTDEDLAVAEGLAVLEDLPSEDEGEVLPEEYLSDESIELLCASDDWAIGNLGKRLRAAQRANTSLRRELRDRDKQEGITEGVSLDSVIEKAVQGLVKTPTPVWHYFPDRLAQAATLEVLLGDFQIGKVSRYYNSERAKKGMELYGKGILKSMHERREKFAVERIAMTMIGDQMEDNEKHGVSSAISTDSGLAEQIVDAVQSIWQYVIKPLAVLGIPMDILCVVGNHASSTRKGMGTFKEGKYSFDYILHKTLQSFCEIAGYTHVTFDIPEGVFGHKTIYGKLAIYEHGYTNAMTEKGMTDQMRKRGGQLEKHAHYFRQGDKHHHICYGQGEQVCNSAFFGIDQEGIEYSGILGFNSIPSQTIMFHVDEDRKGRSNIKDIINIQVAHAPTEIS